MLSFRASSPKEASSQFPERLVHLQPLTLSKERRPSTKKNKAQFNIVPLYLITVSSTRNHAIGYQWFFRSPGLLFSFPTTNNSSLGLDVEFARWLLTLRMVAALGIVILRCLAGAQNRKTDIAGKKDIEQQRTLLSRL